MQQFAVESLTGLGTDQLEVVESTESKYREDLKARYQRKQTWRYIWHHRQLALRRLPLVPNQVKGFVRTSVPTKLRRPLGLDIYPLQRLALELSRKNVVYDEDKWYHFYKSVASPPQ